MVDKMFREATNCSSPWWECESDLITSIEDSIQSGEFEGAETMANERIVDIDGHDIVQWQDHHGGWWTCTEAKNGLDNDFAVFYFPSDAEKFVGKDVPIIYTDKKPIQRGATWAYDGAKEWYVDEEDKTPKLFYEALRELARSI